LNTQGQELTSEKRMQLYWDILLCYWSTDLDKNILYAEEAIQFAEKNNNNPWAARFYRAICISYYRKDQFDLALQAGEKAVKYAVKAGNKKEENAAYLEIANTYMTAGNREMALKSYIDILPALESAQQYDLQAYALINVANLHYNNDERAFNYLKKARTIAEKHNIIGAMNSIYSSIGGIYNERGQQDSAIISILKSYEISKEINDKGDIIISTQMLAGLYGDMNDLENAGKFANECLDNAIIYGDQQKLRVAWVVMAKANMDMKRYKEADTYAYKAWMADSTDLQQAGNASILLCQSNIFLGNHEKADYFLRQYKLIRDRLSDKSLHNSLADMEIKYETEKKEIRILSLEKEKQLYTWLSIAGGLAILMSLGVLFYRKRLDIQKQKTMEQEREIARQKVERLEQEKQLVATQAILDGETAERSRLARDLHDGLGGMLSVVKLNLEKELDPVAISEQTPDQYGKAMKMLDESIVELRRIAHHMMPESLMHSGLKVSLEDFCRSIPNAHFQFIGEDSRLDPRLEVVLYRCAYELINNAVKYANASNINVQLLIEKKIIALTVDDDGIGFDPDKVITGTGLENIRARVLTYHGKMTVRSASGEGTEIILEIESI
jgi:signal transduction histidine kinase